MAPGTVVFSSKEKSPADAHGRHLSRGIHGWTAHRRREKRIAAFPPHALRMATSTPSCRRQSPCSANSNAVSPCLAQRISDWRVPSPGEGEARPRRGRPLHPLRPRRLPKVELGRDAEAGSLARAEMAAPPCLRLRCGYRCHNVSDMDVVHATSSGGFPGRDARRVCAPKSRRLRRPRRQSPPFRPSGRASLASGLPSRQPTGRNRRRQHGVRAKCADKQRPSTSNARRHVGDIRLHESHTSSQHGRQLAARKSRSPPT